MGEVVQLNCLTRLDIPADKVLEGAIGKMDGVVILGYDSEGEEYFASTYGNSAKILWLLERCKQLLLKGNEDE